jgi:hypothetical protein
LPQRCAHRRCPPPHTHTHTHRSPAAPARRALAPRAAKLPCCWPRPSRASVQTAEPGAALAAHLECGLGVSCVHGERELLIPSGAPAAVCEGGWVGSGPLFPAQLAASPAALLRPQRRGVPLLRQRRLRRPTRLDLGLLCHPADLDLAVGLDVARERVRADVDRVLDCAAGFRRVLSDRRRPGPGLPRRPGTDAWGPMWPICILSAGFCTRIRPPGAGRARGMRAYERHRTEEAAGSPWTKRLS